MPDVEKNNIYANAFNLIPLVGPGRLGKIMRCFEDISEAWRASGHDLEKAGLDRKTVQTIISERHHINPDQEYEKLHKKNIQIVTFNTAGYPDLLKEIHVPPPILYIRGKGEALCRFNLALVGTRKISPYGIQVLNDLVPALVSRHINIVTGLAFGVDAEALRLALESGLNPVAVLASPVDNNSISPRTNYALAQKVIEQGAVVSEYPLGAPIQKQNFPIRNRIIAGLSIGTLVVEADENSGSLITANYALEQNRHVFAIPGSIFSESSRGTNKLLKKGARMVTSASDIIEELNLDLIPIKSTDTVKEEGAAGILLATLGLNPTHTDELARESGLSAAETNTALTILELKGRVKNLGGGRYVKTR